jgi:hypothetical protein
LKHIREAPHENDKFCPYYHCNVKAAQFGKEFRSRKEIRNHFNKYHPGRSIDGYECALGLCGKTTRSDRWNSVGIVRHLFIEHQVFISHYQIANILEETKIFGLQHIPAYYLNRWIDCKMCASQVQAPLSVSTPAEATLNIAPF